MSKGETTRDAILEAALADASTSGLSAVTIGELSRKVGMSKSGLFAHFDSKENLQIEILKTAVKHYVDTVVSPSLKAPRGEPRLRAFFDNWFAWSSASSLPGGCLFIAAATEFDDKPGPVRDFIAASQRDWLATLSQAVRIAIDEGHFRKDVDPEQFAHDIYAIILAYHHFSRLLRLPDARERALRSFEQLVASARA